ncbi:hypothetical protein D3C87_1406090 [compost metagenome]
MIADRMRRQCIRLQQYVVARGFAIEREIVAGMADGHHAARELQPFRRRARIGDDGRGQLGRIRRTQRILREQMQDVGQQQFLVLLLVIEPERDQRGFRVGLGVGQ